MSPRTLQPGGMASLVVAASLGFTAPAGAEPVAIVKGTVYLPSGPAEGVTVLFDGGAITAVGPAVEVPPGARIIDATGLVVTPGLIAAPSALGILLVNQEAFTADVDAEGADPIRAELVVSEAYDPSSPLVAISRAQGVTTSILFPAGGLVAGQAGWVQLKGDLQRDAILSAEVAQVAQLGGGKPSRAEALAQLKETLDEARFYRDHRAAWERGEARPLHTSRADLEALQAVLSGEVPLAVQVNRAADIEALLRVTEGTPIRLIVVGGAEAHRVAPLLAERRVPVLLDPMVYGPGSFDELYARPDNAALLRAAGVTVALGGTPDGDTHRPARVRQRAGNAVRGGMDHTDAVQAITSGVADAFGLTDVGRVQAGQRADLVIWSGDPLEISTQVERVFVGGEEVPLTSRHTELLERYRTLPAAGREPLSLPSSAR